MGTYTYTGSLQTVTIATTGVYDIVAYGGQGGDSGGKGAEIGGDVSLTAGTKLTILVGGYGKYGLIASGGGGSFVVSGTTSSNTPLVIAGGGGATGSVAGTYYASEAGQTGTAGAAGRAASGQTFAGGTGGNGGSYEYSSPGVISGGGGGLISPGSPSSSRTNHEGGYSFASGGKGGTSGPRRGAFGGAGTHIGGGGGGYSGGGGGYGGGGGGGSFLTSSLASSVNTVKVAGENAGAGKVVITLLTPPGIAGTVSSQQVASGKTIHPFSGVTITDADTAASDAITITLSGGGTLSGTGLSGGTNGVYTLAAGSAASVTTALQALVFTGMEAAGASATTSFSIAATTNDGAGTTTDTTTTVTTYGSPTITGTAAGQTTTSGVPMHPFSGVTITDPDAAASQTLSISFYYYYEGLYRLYDGTLSGGAGLSGSNGNYTLTASSSTALTAALDSLTYTSSSIEQGESDNVTFTLSDSSSDGSPAATDNTTTLNVYGSPEIFGTGTFSDVISTEGFRPFQSAGISDPDASATDTVTISYTPGAGTLSGPDLTGSSGDYKLTDSASAITSDLTQLVYTPTVPNGQATTTTITLSVQSSDGTAPTTDNQTAIGAFGLPAITGTVTGQTAITGIAVNPFSNVVITDAGNASFQTLTISFTGSGTLTGAGQPDYYGNYTLTASTAAALTQALDAVSFTPTVAAGTQNTVTFTLTDESYPFYSTNSATTVIAYGVPTITGTVAGQAAAAGVGMQPFGTVTVTDPDPPASDTLSISFSGTAGTLSGTGLTGSNGNYTLTASSGTALTAALDAITFTPVEAAGASSSTSFTLADSSSDGLASASNGATSVIAYGAPVIGVPVQPPSVAAGNTVDPLAGVTLLDPDPGATETLTLTLSGGAGTLSGAGLAAGPNRTYTLTVAAGSAQAALQALVFTPGVAPDTTATTTIGIAGASSDGLSAATGTLSVTQYGAPSIAGTQTGQTATAGLPAPPFGGVSIADTAPGATDTVTITLSGAPGTLSGAGLTENQDGSYTLTGSAADVTSQLRALQFTSSDVAAGTQATTTFTLTDSSSDGAAAAPATASVTETGEASLTFGYTGAIETFTVQQTGVYDILGEGAQGSSLPFGAVGGKGAQIGGDVVLTAGQTISILTGGQGPHYGGGGGSFVVASGNVPLVVAGGGGSAAFNVAGGSGQVTEAGGSGDPAQGYGGGTGGNGGGGRTYSSNYFTGLRGYGGGGGLTGNGGGAFGGQSFAQGGAGGQALVSSSSQFEGGFGGGGAHLGGGGGYSGGGAGTYSFPSGGGGSFLTAVAGPADTVQVAGENTGNGLVTLALVAPPTITGAVLDQTLTAGATAQPFSAAVLADPDGNATDTLTVTLTAGAGSFAGSGIVPNPDGSVTLTGSAAAVTAALQALTFTPAGTPGTGEAVSFALSDVSSDGTTVTDPAPAIPAPALTGLLATQTATAGTAATPFATAWLTDPSNGTDTLTITLSGGAGTLSGTGLVANPDGSYTLSGTAPAISAALQALTFVSTGVLAGTQATTNFTLSDASSDGAASTTAQTSLTEVGKSALSFGYTGAIETFTVQQTGVYDIVALGAQGGAALQTTPMPGGAGAQIGGDVMLTAGETVQVLTGGVGQSSTEGGSGGGGSFVVAGADTPLVIAGGGGGGGESYAGAPGVTAHSGTGYNGLNGYQVGGYGTGTGGGGGTGAPLYQGFGGGGGGGFTGAGIGYAGGQSFLGGGKGGVGLSPYNSLFAGGFGGGGGGVSGGGGGYSGGSIGPYPGCGAGGGGSFLTTTAGPADTVEVTGANTGNGLVTIDLVAPPTITGTVAGQPIGNGSPIPLFAGVTIADADAAATETLTISFDGSTGSLSGAGSAIADGVYELTGTAAAVTTKLDAITFDPVNAAIAHTSFLLTDLSTDGTTASDDNTSAACYCPGTAILTPAGEVPVEALAIGDLVVTLDGCHEPITWIGRRSYAKAFVAGNPLMLPVCLKANALADGIPHRDLYVSAGHAIYIDGMLVPAWRLINGRSITQPEPPDWIDYLHIELGHHDILVAEGTPAESFLDDNCRGQFANHAEYARLYPEASAALPVPSVPRLEEGFHLQAIQQRLARRAGLPITPTVPGPLCGYIDVPGPAHVNGWAQDALAPEEPVSLDILAGGRRVARILANRFRQDLRDAGMGSGCHAFAFTLPPGVTGTIEVRRSGDHARLNLTEAALAAVA